jgi:hypothetical protein
MSSIESKFKVASPKIQEKQQLSEEECNDFHYWQEPILEVLELEQNAFANENHQLQIKKMNAKSADTIVISVGVKGTMRRLAKDREPDEVVEPSQKEETKKETLPTPITIHQTNFYYLNSPKANTPKQTHAIQRPLVTQSIENPRSVKIPPNLPPVETPLVVIDGRVVDDGNFIHHEKYQFILNENRIDDSNFIKEDKYLILENGNQVLRSISNQEHSESQISDVVIPHQGRNGNRPVIKIVQQEPNTVSIRVPGSIEKPPIEKFGPNMHNRASSGANQYNGANEKHLRPRISSFTKRSEVGIQRTSLTLKAVEARRASLSRHSSEQFSDINNHSSPSPILAIPTPVSIEPQPTISVDGSHTTLHMEPNSALSQKKKMNLFWWQKLNLLRAVSIGIYTYITTFEGLKDPRVNGLGGKPLLYAILVFSALDMFFALVKAFPHKLWVFWKVIGWDAV